MRHRRVVEGPQNVDEGVGVLVGGDVDEGFRAARAGHREIGEFDRRRNALAGVVHRCQPIQPRVGDFRNANGRFAFAMRGPSRLPRAGHELEKGGFAAGSDTDEGSPEHAKGRIVPLLEMSPIVRI